LLKTKTGFLFTVLSHFNNAKLSSEKPSIALKNEAVDGVFGKNGGFDGLLLVLSFFILWVSFPINSSFFFM